MDGEFTGLIHDKFNFCKNHDLPMPYCAECVDYLSATDTIENLYEWFSKEDIKELYKHNYRVVEYESEDYKFFENHWLINKFSLQNEKVIEI